MTGPKPVQSSNSDKDYVAEIKSLPEVSPQWQPCWKSNPPAIEKAAKQGKLVTLPKELFTRIPNLVDAALDSLIAHKELPNGEAWAKLPEVLQNTIRYQSLTGTQNIRHTIAHSFLLMLPQQIAEQWVEAAGQKISMAEVISGVLCQNIKARPLTKEKLLYGITSQNQRNNYHNICDSIDGLIEGASQALAYVTEANANKETETGAEIGRTIVRLRKIQQEIATDRIRKEVANAHQRNRH